jgi:hypothetical protein
MKIRVILEIEEPLPPYEFIETLEADLDCRILEYEEKEGDRWVRR